MRAHSQRRMIWILNGVLGVGLLAVVAWFALDVRKALGQTSYLKPSFADGAVEAFTNLPDGETSGPPLAVDAKELEEIDVPSFKQKGRHFHWLYSGPKPPTPPKVEKVEGPKAPVISDLEKLGRVHMLIYIPPRRGEAVADETVIAWRFAGAGTKTIVEEFRPGQFLIQPGKETGNIRFANVTPMGGGLYELTYEVYDEGHKIDDEPRGEPSSSGRYEYNGRAALDKALQDRIQLPPSAAEAAAAAAAAAAGAAEEAGAAANGPRTAVVPGTPGVVDAPGVDPDATEPPAVEDIKPTLTWEDERRTRARIEFDQTTYDYMRSRDAQSIAKTVKTQVLKDGQGKTVGLQFTGVDETSPASKFGIQRGDILVSIDGRAVGSRDDAVNIIQGMDPNVSSVTIVIRRLGKDLTYVIDPRDPKLRRDARYLENAR